jgi:hypothetical protein
MVIPIAVGKKVITKICRIVVPIGNSIAALCPKKCWLARLVKMGIVNIVIKLLKAVSVTLRATSPFAKNVIKLEETPPGHKAIIINPVAIAGCIGTILVIANPIIGNTIN